MEIEEQIEEELSLLEKDFYPTTTKVMMRDVCFQHIVKYSGAKYNNYINRYLMLK